MPPDPITLKACAKVLIADDDRVNRSILERIARQCHYEVVSVSDGQAALAALTQPDAPPIVLLDWDMPHLTGPEICSKLRKYPFEIDPWIIIVTSRTAKEDIVAALNAGADDFCSKPLNLSELQARLRVAHRNIGRQFERNAAIAALQVALKEAQAKQPEQGRSKEVAAFTGAQFDTIVASAMRGAGQLGELHRLHASVEGRPVSWASLVLPQQEEWVDIILEMDRANMRTLHAQATVSTCSGPQTLTDYLRQIPVVLRASLRSVLKALHEPALMQMPSFVLPSIDRGIAQAIMRGKMERHTYAIEDAQFNIVVLRHPSPRQEKRVDHLASGDILAESFPPNAAVPLIFQGTVLDGHLIDRLRDHARVTTGAPENTAGKVAVFTRPASAFEILPSAAA